MAILRAKDIKNMKDDERKKKIKELKLELVKSQATASQGGSNKTREIKRTIARLMTKQ
jgi:ribosomal protein L29